MIDILAADLRVGDVLLISCDGTIETISYGLDSVIVKGREFGCHFHARARVVLSSSPALDRIDGLSRLYPQLDD